MWPQSRLLGPNLVRLPAASAARGEVALTFDDGPDPLVTPAVLDLLDEEAAQATFFCIGRRAAAYPGLLREIVRRGHGVENHSDTHPFAFGAYGPVALHRELSRAQQLIADITGDAPRFFRAPMGLRSPLLDPVLHGLGLRLVSWTHRALDGVRGDAGAGLRGLTRRLAPGDILLLHDGNAARAAGRPVVLEILPALLGRMTALGLRSVRLSLESPNQQDRKTQEKPDH